MPQPDKTERFIRHLTDTQDALFAYIHALVGDLHAAQDVLQETHIVLWRKFDEFTEGPGSSFAAWSKRVAFYQVKAMRRDASRDRLMFDDALLDQLAKDAEAIASPVTARSVALERCLAKLPDDQRALVSKRYSDSSATLDQLAADVGKSLSAVTMALSRIRHGLIECIERETKREDA